MKVPDLGWKAVILWLGLAAVLAVLPLLGLPRTWILFLFLFFIYLALANMWNLLSGYCGLISLCQPAFIGLAGYALVIFTWNGLPVYLGIAGGALAAGLFAAIISVAVFRLRGIYFAIGTLVVPEALRVIFLLWRPVGEQIHGKGAGYMLKGLNEVSMTHIYWLAILVGIASLFVMRLILSSKMGLGLAAIRDNDKAASSSGINIFALKLFAFVISAAISAIAGAVFFMFQGYISPESGFSMKWTMTMILATVIGGISTEAGPVIGTVVIVFLHFVLARYAGVSLIIQGVLLILIMLLAPQGIMGFIRNNRFYRSLTRATAVNLT
ncbi:MAG: branched-chain amino acid ABC transporter permease [Deltaproteobacteria bacterium HGW-Deltaproteobacteria-21]|nr:MAG: branched-chain amino acid ABC transporter permease [Deltaproteobacteria bacterium HGW-Deltaproteobacteria-21]